jgi:bifunctional non-homologous end joining protein LigD
MLAGSTGVPADASERMVEPKWDGVRIIATLTGGRLRLESRNGRDVTGAYPELDPPPSIGADVVVDGEVVAIDEHGHANFGLLQRRMHVLRPTSALRAAVPVTFAVFDLLWTDGEMLIDQPQRERRRRLEGLGLGPAPWVTTPVLDFPADRDLLGAARTLGLEGFMLKRLDAAYLPGRRSAAWAKLKCLRRREFVVGGWLEGKGGGVGSLALGVWEAPDHLRYVGMVGSGLKAAGAEALAGLERPRTPFAGPTPRGVRYLEPMLVAEVTFSEVTTAGTLRQPVLVGFRTDKDPRDVLADDELR